MTTTRDIAILGPKGSGKTSLIRSLIWGDYRRQYIPTWEDIKYYQPIPVTPNPINYEDISNILNIPLDISKWCIMPYLERSPLRFVELNSQISNIPHRNWSEFIVTLDRVNPQSLLNIGFFLEKIRDSYNPQRIYLIGIKGDSPYFSIGESQIQDFVEFWKDWGCTPLIYMSVSNRNSMGISQLRDELAKI